MFHSLARNTSLFEKLQRIDADAAAIAATSACRFCEERLHRAAFARKPRGLPDGADGDAASQRPSFCCSADECRRRYSPPLILFLPRRVYSAVVILLVAAMRQEPDARSLRRIECDFGVPPATVRRWLAWWRDHFPTSRGWRAVRARLVPPVADDRLPRVLVDRLGGTADGIVTALRLVREATAM